jgi:uncharacterized membrane protein HdeD (DUF308 family)
VFALRGLLAVAFGFLTLLRPFATAAALALLFGAFAVMDGAFHLVAGLNRAQRGRRWGGLVAGGVLGIAAGLLALAAPYWTAMGLVLVLWSTVAVWALAAGVALLQAAARLRRVLAEEWLLAMSGLILVLMGIGVLILFWTAPGASVVSLAYLLSLAAFSGGAVNLMLAWKLFRQGREHSAPAPR